MFLAESIVHTLDAYAFQFGGGFGIRWYGLAYAAGFLVGWLLLRWLARRGSILLTPVQVGDFVFFVVMGVVLGGRIGHVLLYDRGLLTTFHAAFPWWGVLDIHHGGMSSHGGIAGVAIASLLFARRARVPFLHLMDCAAIGAPPGLAFGRLANWVNGELPGKALPLEWWSPAPWWSTKFPREVLDPDFPRLAELLPLRRAGVVDPALEFPRSLVDACYAGNADAVRALAPHLTPHWPNQFMQALTDGPVLLAVLLLVWWRPRRPGVVSGWFFAAYGTLRLGTEQLREPDAGVFWLGPLTLPMLLSLAMIAFGAALAAWSGSRRGSPAIGGIGPRRREGSPTVAASAPRGA